MEGTQMKKVKITVLKTARDRQSKSGTPSEFRFFMDGVCVRYRPSVPWRMLRSTVQVESSRISPLRFMFQIERAMYFSMSRCNRL